MYIYTSVDIGTHQITESTNEKHTQIDVHMQHRLIVSVGAHTDTLQIHTHPHTHTDNDTFTDHKQSAG